MWTIILPLLIYWLVMFVACFVVVEFGQDQLYDEVTPHGGLKVAAGSLVIAIVLTVLRKNGLAASYDSMFTSNIIWTVLQGLVWFGVFTLIFQFHPWHALGLGVATMLLVTGLSTMGVDSLLTRRVPTSQSTRSFISNQPVRQSVAPRATAAPSESPPPRK
jgi:drug/metabolite transporter (DMT)-like permease